MATVFQKSMSQTLEFLTTQSKWSAFLWQTAAVCLAILGAPLPFFSTPILNILNRFLTPNVDPSSQSVWLQAVVFVMTLTAAGYCELRAKKHRALSADKLLLKDRRAPIVYCRSFWDEFDSERSFRRILYRSWRAARGYASEEEQLAEALTEVGPFVGFGAPENHLPELGAARIYTSNLDWQERANELMSRAQIVVFRPGNTPGFWWEVGTAIKLRPPERMVFLLPFDKNEYDDFCRRMKPYTPRELPDYPDRVPRNQDLKTCLYFDPDGTPHIVPFEVKNVKKNPHRPLVATLKAVTDPMIRRLGLKWKRPPRYGFLGLRIWDLFLASFLIAIIAFLGYVFVRMAILNGPEVLLLLLVIAAAACLLCLLLRAVGIFLRDK